jgi:hypothetical protein
MERRNHPPSGRVRRTASVLQASGFRSDVTVFRLNARSLPKTGSEPAFRRNTAACVCTIEAAHNPEVAGSNPVPATQEAPETGPFCVPTTRSAGAPPGVEVGARAIVSGGGVAVGVMETARAAPSWGRHGG